MRYRNTWENAVVGKMEKVAENVMEIQLIPAQGTAVFTVGSHVDISVLINDVPEVRSYSLVGQYEPNSPYTLQLSACPQVEEGLPICGV